MDRDIEQKLERLKSLYDKGLLSATVWEEKQKELLASAFSAPSPQKSPPSSPPPPKPSTSEASPPPYSSSSSPSPSTSSTPPPSSSSSSSSSPSETVTVRVSIPDEVEGGFISETLSPTSTVGTLKQLVVTKIKARFGDPAVACVPFQDSDFGFSIENIPADDFINEKLLVADDTKVADAKFIKEGDKKFLAFLVNLSGRETCGPIKPVDKSAQWQKEREERARQEKERLKAIKEGKEPEKRKEVDPDLPKDPWGDIVLTDLEGKEVKISTKWQNQRIIAVLVRRFGCALCQHQTDRIMQLKPKLDYLGVKMIAIGNGNKRFATKFRDALKFDGDIFLDPEVKSFKAMSLPRLSAWQTMKRMFTRRVIGFYSKLSKNYPSADVEGDGQQTGGVFVLGPGVGRPLRFAFRENDYEPDVFADLDQLLEACGWTKDSLFKFYSVNSLSAKQAAVSPS